MTDYLKKYRKALKAGDAEKANEYYEKYRGSEDDVEETVEEEDGGGSSEEDEPLASPGEMTVDEAKEYAEGIENVETFLELEKDGKERKTLVNYLEDMLE